ncbi:MAG: TonB C-terminal domain-containing protein [Bacteriovoracaceae bacterium]|jgi:TonB family protein|nr:TonB C-terminal domain-containing protein [Bacteriovoracaceae bacterium]
MLAIQDSYNKSIFLASAIHIVVFAIALFADSFKFAQTKLPEVDLIKTSVRVDLVGMPKLTVQELKKIKLVPLSGQDKIEKQIKVEKENIHKARVEDAVKNVDLSNLLGSISKKKIVKKQKTKKIKSKQLDKYKKDLNKIILEGNVVTKGTTATGDTDYSRNEKFVSYIQTLPALIRPNWKLPTYLLDQDLKCRIQVFISKDGKINNFKIIESSGVDEFDKRAISALKLTNQFPAPENDIILKVSSGQVVLGFPL